MAENDRKDEVEQPASLNQSDETPSSPPTLPSTESEQVGDQQAEREKAHVSAGDLVTAMLLFSFGILLCAVAFSFGVIPLLMATEYLSKMCVWILSLSGLVTLIGGTWWGLPLVERIATAADSRSEPKRSEELYGIYLIGIGFAFLKLTIIGSLVFVGVAWSLNNRKPCNPSIETTDGKVKSAANSKQAQGDEEHGEGGTAPKEPRHKAQQKSNENKLAQADAPAESKPGEAGEAPKPETPKPETPIDSVRPTDHPQGGAGQSAQSPGAAPPNPATNNSTPGKPAEDSAAPPGSLPSSQDAFGQLFGRSPEEAFKIIGLFAISSLVAAMGALFFFCSSLWAKIDEAVNEPFDRRLFWGGLWFRLGEAMLFNVVFFLVIRSYSPTSDLMLPLVSLFVGMFLKTGETIISGIAARVFAAVQSLIPGDVAARKVLKVVSFKLLGPAQAADARPTQVEQLVRSLKALPGVLDAQGDAATMTFQVEYDEIRITPADIRRKISLAGWSEDSSA